MSAPRLRDGDVAQRAPRREDPTGGGVPQVDQVRQAGGLVGDHRLRDGDHLDERRCALLHPGAARGRGDQQRQPLAGRPRDRGDDPCGGGAPDGPAEEAELAHDDGDLVSADAPGARDDGFVDAGPCACPRELLRVGGVDARGVDGRVPAGERAVVEDEPDQAASIQTGAHAVAPSVSQARTVTPSPSRGAAPVGGVCHLLTTDQEQASATRSVRPHSPNAAGRARRPPRRR